MSGKLQRLLLGLAAVAAVYFGSPLHFEPPLPAAAETGSWLQWRVGGAAAATELTALPSTSGLESLLPIGDAPTYWLATLGVGGPFAAYVAIVVMRLRRARNDLRARNAELLEAKHEAQEAQAQLFEAVEAMSEGFVIFDADDRLILCNSAYRNLHPHVSHVIRRGQTFEEIVRANVNSGLVPDAVGREDEWVAERMRRWRDPSGQESVIRQAGRWMMHRDMRTPSGKRVGIRADVTSLKEREAELQEAKRQVQEAQDQLLEAVEAMDEGFALYGADDRLILCNSAYRKLHPHLAHVIQPGRTFEEIVSANVYSGSISEAVGREEEWLSERIRRRRDAVHTELVSRQADKWILHRDRRTPSGKVVVIRADVSTLKEREIELAEAKEKAVLADRAKSEFLANMSHEIRTPMNGIMGMAQLLARTDLDAKQKMYADVIVRSGNALVTIINDILDFSKIEAGGLELDSEPFALAEAVEEVATLFSTGAEEKGLELAVRIAPGLPEMVVGDAGRLRQIVANLLGNAVKFTESGHVLLDVAGRCADGEADLLVKVVDTGIGIPPDKVESIFDRFSQVDGSSTRKYEGTGLGLAVCKGLVERMGGEIGLESKPGEGSVFWVSLRLPVHGEAAPVRVAPDAVAGAHILVVDDNETNRTILLEQLTAWQFQAEAVGCGEEGLAALRQAAREGRPFDLVVLDYNMPGMNGAEMARAIHAEPPLAASPIVMLTSVDQPDDAGHLRGAGVQARLVKPARFALLLETLVAVLHAARSGRTEPQESRSVGAGAG